MTTKNIKMTKATDKAKRQLKWAAAVAHQKIDSDAEKAAIALEKPMNMTMDERRMLYEIHSTLIGNIQMGEIGIAKKVDSMWTVFSGLTLLGKFATWAAVILAGVGAVWTVVVHFFMKPIK